MENKLQELTQKLYDQGLEKGRTEAERLVAEAKSEAAKILSEAHVQSESILRKAQAQAEDTQKNALTEIALAGKQAVAKLRAEIASMIIARSISTGVKDAAMDAAFIKQMLLSMAANWSGANSSKIELKALLPEADRAKFDAAFAQSVTELLTAGVEVGYSKDVKSGFKVGVKNGGYYISFSDEDFDALLKEYLREKVSKILYQA